MEQLTDADLTFRRPTLSEAEHVAARMELHTDRAYKITKVGGAFVARPTRERLDDDEAETKD